MALDPKKKQDELDPMSGAPVGVRVGAAMNPVMSGVGPSSRGAPRSGAPGAMAASARGAPTLTRAAPVPLPMPQAPQPAPVAAPAAPRPAAPAAPLVSSATQRQWNASNARAADRGTAQPAQPRAALVNQGARDQAMSNVQALGAKYRPPVMQGVGPTTRVAPATSVPGELAVAPQGTSTLTRAAPAPVPMAPQAAAAPVAPATPLARSSLNPPAAPAAAPMTPVARAAAPAVPAAAAAEAAAPRVLGTFTGKSGTRTITEADATALGGRVATANAMPVTGPNGSFAVGDGGAAPAVAELAAPTLQRPDMPVANVQSSRSIIGNPGEDERRLKIAIDSVLARPARSRGERQLQAELLRGINGQYAQARDLEAKDAQAALEANTSLVKTGAEQAGQNYRTELSDAGSTQRTVLGERGANERAKMAQDGENFRLENRPEYTVGEDGTTSLVRGSRAQPVTDADGKPFRSRQSADSGSITDATLFEAYSKEAAAIGENTLLKPDEREAAMAALQQRPEYSGVLRKLRGGEGKQQFREGGVYTDANGNRAKYVNGKWEPVQ